MKIKYLIFTILIMMLILITGNLTVNGAYTTHFYDSKNDKWEVGDSWDFGKTNMWYTSYNIFCTKAGAKTPTNVTVYNRMDSSDGKTFNWANDNGKFTDAQTIKFLYIYSTLNDEIAKGDVAGRRNNYETLQQQAIWEVLGGQNLTSAAKKYKKNHQDLIDKMLANAEAYYQFWLNNGGDVKTSIDTSNVDLNNNRLGPFKLSFYQTEATYNNQKGTYGGVEKIELVSSENLAENVLCYSKDGGNVLLSAEPTPNTNLYINVKNIDIAKYDSIKVTFVDGYIKEAYLILAKSSKSGQQSSMFGTNAKYTVEKIAKFELEDKFTFKIIKTDNETGKRMAGVKFLIGYADNSVSQYITNENGEVNISIIVKNGKEEIAVNIHEVTPNGYEPLGYGVQLTFKKENKQWKCEQDIQAIYENGKGDLEDGLVVYVPKNPLTNSMVGTLYVKNEPEDPNNPYRPSNPNYPDYPDYPDYPNYPDNPDNPDIPDDPTKPKDIIEGYVYLDGYSGNKIASSPNGQKEDDEQTLKGIIVRLSDGRVTVTDNNGYYKFTNVVRGQDYTVTFEYDGINYEATTTGEGSQAAEVGRNEFNDKFKTINYAQSGVGIGLNYWKFGDSSNWNPKYNDKPGWLLMSLNENLEIMNNDYKMTATTEFKLENDVQYDYKWAKRVRSHSEEECNCSWGSSGQKWYDTTKEPDISEAGCTSGTYYDLQGTNYYIKGGTTQTRDNTAKWYYYEDKYTSEETRNKTVTYNLNFGLVKREMDLSAVNDLKEVVVTVNGKTTTYHYEDIPVTGDAVEIGNENSGTNTYILELDEKDYLYGSVGNNYADANNHDLQQYSEENKLKIEATYKVVLNNQHTEKATINSIVYYYDASYKLNGISKGTNSEATPVTIDGKNYNKIDITDLNIELEAGAQAELEVYLEINARGDQIQKETYKTIVEITSYSTETGKIDIDSAPGNALQEGSLEYEDDTDEAPGLKITATGTRVLSGYVWDDSKKTDTMEYIFADGIKEDKEQGIADVIVQLIEIKEVAGEKHYYLWQEVLTKEDGTYSFTNFVPGNYIVRFNYGNGTSDIAKKYNGQDYKSTTDINYDRYKNGEWYNDYHDLADNTSVARDYEARRLDTIANTTEIDTSIGTALKNNTDIINSDSGEILWKYIDNTYMYADTSKINIAVTSETGKETTNSNAVEGNEGNYYNFQAINFGLEERPKTKIELERHITGLRLTANDGTTIVDAELLKDENGRVIFTPNSIVRGLQAFYATRENRAKWYLATDIEEVVQGATLEIVYTYTVKNVGEIDYISTTLAEEFENKNVATYKELLKEKANEIRNNIKANDYNSILGKYLGTTYYTGNVGTDVSIVKTTVGKIEDYINNELKFNAVQSSDFEINAAGSGKSYDLLKPQKETETWSTTKETINTVVISKYNVGTMSPEDNPRTQTIILESNGKLTSTGTLDFPGYIAQIKTAYSNAMGRRDTNSIPGNLKYIYNDSLENNESDEYWVETVEITKPTGADRQTAVTLAASITAGMVILVSGIATIKKYLI